MIFKHKLGKIFASNLKIFEIINTYALEQLFNQIGNCLTKIEEIAYFAYQNQSKLTHYISNILFLLIRTKNIHKNAYVIDFGHIFKTSRKFSASVSISLCISKCCRVS